MPTESISRATPSRQQGDSAVPRQPPSLWIAMRRGATNRCPVCGEGKVFGRYLKVVPECSHCHTPLGSLRADDAPPYIVILLTGHILVPFVLAIEKAYQPAMWLQMVVWLPLFTLICLALLPPVKGAVIGLMLRTGFLGTEHGSDPAPAATPNLAPAGQTPNA